MSSVGSVIAQNPYRANYFVSVGTTGAIAYDPATVEATAPTGVTAGATTQVIQCSSVANAVSVSSGYLLDTSGGVDFSIATAGVLLRDMGRQVHVQVNGQTVYTLAKVQNMTGSASEGVAGSAPTTTGGGGYNTYYVCTFSSDPSNNSGGGATPAVGVARVGGF